MTWAEILYVLGGICLVFLLIVQFCQISYLISDLDLSDTEHLKLLIAFNKFKTDTETWQGEVNAFVTGRVILTEKTDPTPGMP